MSRGGGSDCNIAYRQPRPRLTAPSRIAHPSPTARRVRASAASETHSLDWGSVALPARMCRTCPSSLGRSFWVIVQIWSRLRPEVFVHQNISQRDNLRPRGHAGGSGRYRKLGAAEDRREWRPRRPNLKPGLARGSVHLPLAIPSGIFLCAANRSLPGRLGAFSTFFRDLSKFVSVHRGFAEAIRDD